MIKLSNVWNVGYLFRGNKSGKGDKGVQHLLRAQRMLDYLFSVSIARPMTNEGAKTCPAPTASTAGTYLSVVDIGPRVPRHLQEVNCSLEGMLEFDFPM